MNTAKLHRDRLKEALERYTFEHQRIAAQRAFRHLNEGSRAVVIVAEMQSGKSGIALALSTLQRESLSDTDICKRTKLKDTLYLVTMADTALLEQAKQDLAPCINVVVSNFNQYELSIKTHFSNQTPKLIIIDECHYGSGNEAIRYAKVFDYLEKENPNCKVAFISATPFSALYSASSDSILRHDFNTSLVFHKASDEYHGIREMHRNNQIVKLSEDQRDFCEESLMRRRFIRQYLEHEGAGWSLIRVPSSQASLAKQILLANGIPEEQIMIIGQRLMGVEDSELVSIDDFKREYQTAAMFEDKVIAVTVAGFRAGINFGQEMKSTLINTWDSTIANIAAIVQANIGRACGYHHNKTAKHYTNLDAVRAYSELLDHLESRDEGNDFSGLQEVFENICTRYDVKGFDRGTTVANEPDHYVSRKLNDSQTYLTSNFVVVPGKLDLPDFDYSVFTVEKDILEAIALIREELLHDGGPYRKKGRALRGAHQNWIKAQWVNGATYDDGTASCAKSRALYFTSKLRQGEPVEFNEIVNPGGGEKTEDKRVMASIFSTFNLSGQMNAFKRAMDMDDMEEISQLLDIELDNTVILLYVRGDYSEVLSQEKQSVSLERTRIKNNSVF